MHRREGGRWLEGSDRPDSGSPFQEPRDPSSDRFPIPQASFPRPCLLILGIDGHSTLLQYRGQEHPLFLLVYNTLHRQVSSDGPNSVGTRLLQKVPKCASRPASPASEREGGGTHQRRRKEHKEGPLAEDKGGAKKNAELVSPTVMPRGAGPSKTSLPRPGAGARPGAREGGRRPGQMRKIKTQKQ
ncbi:uncharacterized protein LOC110741572 [Papio anubis]|uniref:uncharacterized protein LOC110741572 n=1 Tax=Papio anubis TaxID=9555 RepID=UPI000B7B5960|nr:uncharacterized protein LOC110741572 [Papio anubis]XP_021784314.1 uncharacterized protein LOC110741572 [Papio anubis]XP_021784315.1 uncharacterized protein LOC110741572 [Papio anubis]